VNVEKKPNHEYFSSTKRGINWDSFPMKLYEKGKKLGIWNPSDIDFSIDRKTYEKLPEYIKETLIHLTSLFLAGEESVDLDLAPLIIACARKNWLEEVMYLSNFIFEEAKHVEFFRKFLDSMNIKEDLSKFHGASYRKIFYEELPKAMNKLIEDDSYIAFANAAVTYNMIVEGVLAETGYEGYRRIIEGSNLNSPGLLKGITLIAQDEARHIAFGTYLIAKIINEEDKLYDYVIQRLEELLPYAIGVVREILETEYTMKSMEEANLSIDYFLEYASNNFAKRINAIDKFRKNLFGIEKMLEF